MTTARAEAARIYRELCKACLGLASEHCVPLIESALLAERRRAIQDAAQVCQRFADGVNVGGCAGESLGGLIARRDDAKYPYSKCAKAIRSLASPREETTG